MRNIAQKLIDWEWLILLLLIPMTLFPFSSSGLLLLLIPIFWLLRKIAVGHFVTPTPYDLAVLLLLVMVGISFLVMFDAAVSAPKIAAILLGIALFYGAVGFSRGKGRRLWPVVTFVLLTGSMMALVGLVGAEWLPPFAFLNGARVLLPLADGVPGTVGGLVNANELAGTLSWIVPLMAGCLLGVVRWHDRRRPLTIAILALGTLFTGFILVATLSRGGILAMAAGLILVALFYISPRWRLVIAIASLVVVVGLLAYGGSRFSEEMVGGAAGDLLGLSGRLEIWSRALIGIGDFPLTGMGVNSFRRVVTVLYPLFGIPPEIDLGHAHNHLLQVALDLGLPGLASYLALWFISATLLWQTARALVGRYAIRHPYYGLTAGLAGALLAGWVFGIFDTVALGARPSFIWWLLLGLTASVHYAVLYSGERLKRPRRTRMASFEPAPVVLPNKPDAPPFPPVVPEKQSRPEPARPVSAGGRYSGPVDGAD